MSSRRRQSSPRLPSIDEDRVPTRTTSFADRHVNTMQSQIRRAQPLLSEPLRTAINASFGTLIVLGIDEKPFRDIPSFNLSREAPLDSSLLRDSLTKLTVAIESLGKAGSQAEKDLGRDTDSDDEAGMSFYLTDLVLAVEAIRKGFKEIAGSLASV